MNRKTVSGIVLMLLLTSMLSSAFIIQPVKAEAGPDSTVYVDPSTITVQVGATFDVSIMVSNVQDLWAWQAGIQWDPNVLEFVSLARGDLQTLAEIVLDPFFTVDQATGRIYPPATETILRSSSPVSVSSLKLMSITFRVVNSGISSISLINVVLKGQDPATTTAYAGWGDADSSLTVDIFDLSLVAAHRFTGIGDPGYYPSADFNGDDFLDVSDLAIVSSNYGKVWDGLGDPPETPTLYDIPITLQNGSATTPPAPIYIRADGSVDPLDAPIQRDGNLYTFTDNVYASIVVERDNIVIDGAGYTVQGMEDERGIDLSYRSNVAIKNTEIKAFYSGVVLWYSNYNSIIGNNITGNNLYGIAIWYSNHNNVSGNNIANNWIGIAPAYSNYNSVSGNNIANNLYGFYVYDSSYNHIYHNDIVNNWMQAFEDLTSMNPWRTPTKPYQGNYWSDYKGIDANGDGIGDTYIPWAHVDWYPVMKPWTSTPAPPTPDFAIEATPDSLTIQPGDLNTSSIIIRPLNGLSPLDLAVTSPPIVGVTFTLYCSGVLHPPDRYITYNLTVDVASNAMPDIYTITVTGNSGTLTHSVDISLEITAVPPPPEKPPKFLTLPFRDPDVKVQQGWIYTWDPDPDAHKGIDYIKGTIDKRQTWQSFDVVAAADGWAMWSEQPGSTGVYGKFVFIRHDEKDDLGNDYFTLCAHLESVATGIPYQDRHNIDYNYNDASKWKFVKRGEVIGRAGNTGALNTGIHLHFEVQRGGYFLGKTDPYDLYKTRDFYPSGSSYAGCGQNHLWTTDPPSLPPALSDDIYWLAKTIMSEAEGYTEHEQIAVGWTVLNRLDSGRFENSIKDIVTSPGQYAHNKEPTKEIEALAKELLERKKPDPTDGATYFFSPISMPKLYTWWKIEYEAGVTGWSAENWLEYVSTPQEPSPSGSKFKKDDIVKTTVADLAVRKGQVYNNYWKIYEIGGIKTKVPEGSQGKILEGPIEASTPIGKSDIGGGLHLVPSDPDDEGTPLPADRQNKVWFPGWAKPEKEITETTTIYLTAEKIPQKKEWRNLPVIRNWCFMFYRLYTLRNKAEMKSPGELRVYDSQGRVTGLVNGTVVIEIPGSVYFENTVVIFFPNETYRYVVMGATEGLYGLTVTAVTRQENITFAAVDIPTSANATHQFTIDWVALSWGEEGVTLQIDPDGDGIFEQTITADNELTHDEFMLQTATTIDFDPDTLNLGSEGKWVTVYIELPEGYNVSQIDVSSIMLNGTVPALTKPIEIGDYDGDGIPDLMVKFDRAEVIALLSVGEATLTMTGEVSGIPFQGNDTIRVIDK